ncbi:MAG: proline dehydrogenase [Novosphingobium sp.]
MSGALWARLRDARYALPGKAGRLLPAPGVQSADRFIEGLARHGIAATPGYFAPDGATAGQVVAVYRELHGLLDRAAYFSVKAPQLGFSGDAMAALAGLGREIVLDAHAPGQTDATHALADRFGTGLVIPARWRRSADDAADWRQRTVRIRLVKGEWADPNGDTRDQAKAFLELARILAGRAAPVAVATHDPLLAANALEILRQSGTPVELEQLRGLPHRRPSAAARASDVPVRLYVPFGPGWWPYAIDKALARPYLPRWWLEDRLGLNPGRAPGAA